jgi:hypothetical protein
VEDTPTIFLVLEREPHAKTCASLVLRMGMEAAKWSKASDACEAMFFESPHAFLFGGYTIHAGLDRSRIQERVDWSGSARPAGGKAVFEAVARRLNFHRRGAEEAEKF